MIFNKTTKYAFQIIYLIAERRGERISAKRIGDELNIPYKYLTQILLKLKKNGLILSNKGKNGGYVLKKPASEIFLSDIVGLFDDLSELDKCLFHINENCEEEFPCPLHKYWGAARDKIKKMLFDVSIENLLKKQ